MENSDIVPFKRPNISANGDKPWEGDNNEDLSDESDDDLDLNLVRNSSRNSFVIFIIFIFFGWLGVYTFLFIYFSVKKKTK